MKVGLVIPWRSQPSRIPPFESVLGWYEKNFPDINIYLSDRSGVWNLSASRNDGVLKAQKDNCDVVIVNDADTIPEFNPVMEALRSAVVDGYCHTPYTNYIMLTKGGTAQHIRKGTPLSRCAGRPYKEACSGVYIATPEMWFGIGGQDEKFTGWGYEDNAWHRAHEVILGIPSVRHKGNCYAFNHIDQPHSGPQYEANKELWLRYLEIDNKEDMLNLVKAKK